MAKGISLHIGLNFVDPDHYSGWDGELTAAEFDANDMHLLANSLGFSATKLIRESATRSAVIKEISDAGNQLNSEDFFFLTYSGHGGQLPDLNGDEEEGLDETWCLFDGELVDDELNTLWMGFKKGVRIFVLSDSCHSGTVVRLAREASGINPDYKPKYMPDEVKSRTYYKNKRFYDDILQKPKLIDTDEIQASVKLISGCQDNQSSFDGPFNGLFTGTLKRVWNGGKFKGNYMKFHSKIKSLLPPDQSPNLYNIGQVNKAFDNQKPFII